jgi:hypothetical protein
VIITPFKNSQATTENCEMFKMNAERKLSSTKINIINKKKKKVSGWRRLSHLLFTITRWCLQVLSSKARMKLFRRKRSKSFLLCGTRVLHWKEATSAGKSDNLAWQISLTVLPRLSGNGKLHRSTICAQMQ